MSGPEIHANIIETLLTGRFPRPVPRYLSSFYLIGILTGGCILFYWLSPWRGLAAGLALCTLAALGSYLLFRQYWLLPTVNAQLEVMISYIGILGIKLTGEERERARIRKIFSRYVADEVVEKLLAAGKLPDLGGEVFQVTVLFSDIRNFTTISENLGPRQVVEMLNTYLSQACEPILAQGGTVDKFIGDAVMAVFGAPVSYPDHARRALQAALDLAQKAQEFRAWMRRRFSQLELPDFAIGIGLHTGEAIVGNIGSPKRLEFTSIGDTVNTASRLESLTYRIVRLGNLPDHIGCLPGDGIEKHRGKNTFYTLAFDKDRNGYVIQIPQVGAIDGRPCGSLAIRHRQMHPDELPANLIPISLELRHDQINDVCH
jgi:adenylate cyclase